MSSFICSAKHFNSVENAVVDHCIDNANFWMPYNIQKRIPGLDHHATREQKRETVHAIFTTLRELQVLCVSLQYKHHYDGTLDEEIKQQMTAVKQKTGVVSLTRIGLYKAIGGILYQIETEHLEELRELTQSEKDALFFARTLENGLAKDIVSDLSEYETAKWEIE